MICYLTRSKLNLLILHFNEPVKSENTHDWFSKGNCIILPRNEFPEVTYENSPIKYELRSI